MRAHWSDGHLYSGDRVRKLQANHYFLIDTGAGEKVFLHLHDAECYCMEHKLDPEDRYLCLLEWGASPQEARAVLPNSLKTEIVVTANLREWRNIFKLRAVGVTGKPHPQMLEVMVPLLEEVKKQIPVVFDDLVTE